MTRTADYMSVPASPESQVTPAPTVGAGLVKRIGGVAIGTAIGQACVFLSTPVLARLYPPAAFGELSLFMTVATYAAAIGCLRYDLVLSSGRREQREGLLKLCLLTAMVVSIVAGAIALLPLWRGAVTGFTLVLQHPLQFAGTIAAVACYQAVSADKVAQGEFKSLSLMRGGQGFSFAALSVLHGIGLVGALLASYALTAGAALRGFSRKGWNVVSELAWEHRRFPMLSLPGALFDALACSAVIIVISECYGLSQVGQFSQVQRVVGAPLLLVSASMYQVYLRRAADDYHAGRQLIPMLQRSALLAAVAVACALLLIGLFGKAVLSRMLGAGWRVDTYFLLLVVAGIAVRVCVSPFSSVLITTRRLGLLASWQVAYLLTSFGVLTIAAHRLVFDYFLAVYVVHESLMYLIYFVLIHHAARSATK